jgi:hypothetical protein
MLRLAMEAKRQELTAQLEAYYRSCGWKVRRADDGTVRADGPGGVTWIGMPVVREDLGSPEFDDRLLELSEQRMPRGGELCPFELLPASECADDVRARLARLRLHERGNVAVYSIAA